jgi:hypothetical protein
MAVVRKYAHIAPAFDTHLLQKRTQLSHPLIKLPISKSLSRTFNAYFVRIKPRRFTYQLPQMHKYPPFLIVLFKK